MVYKSWGAKPHTDESERTPGTGDRADRAWRPQSGTSAAPALSRLDLRAEKRAAQARLREVERQARHDADLKLTVKDPHAAAERRTRGSGRKDIVRQDRDTSGYTITVDATRVRALAQRGTSIAGLAAAFGLDEREVVAILNDPRQ